MGGDRHHRHTPPWTFNTLYNVEGGALLGHPNPAAHVTEPPTPDAGDTRTMSEELNRIQILGARIRTKQFQRQAYRNRSCDLLPEVQQLGERVAKYCQLVGHHYAVTIDPFRCECSRCGHVHLGHHPPDRQGMSPEDEDIEQARLVAQYQVVKGRWERDFLRVCDLNQELRELRDELQPICGALGHHYKVLDPLNAICTRCDWVDPLPVPSPPAPGTPPCTP
jgi:hypothetical protein